MASHRGQVTSVFLRPDERAALDAMTVEVGCRRQDLFRIGLHWLYGRHPAEVERLVATLPPSGNAGRRPLSYSDSPHNKASRPEANETAGEQALTRSADAEPTGPTA